MPPLRCHYADAVTPRRRHISADVSRLVLIIDTMPLISCLFISPFLDTISHCHWCWRHCRHWCQAFIAHICFTPDISSRLRWYDIFAIALFRRWYWAAAFLRVAADADRRAPFSGCWDAAWCQMLADNIFAMPAYATCWCFTIAAITIRRCQPDTLVSYDTTLRHIAAAMITILIIEISCRCHDCRHYADTRLITGHYPYWDFLRRRWDADADIGCRLIRHCFQLLSLGAICHDISLFIISSFRCRQLCALCADISSLRRYAISPVSPFRCHADITNVSLDTFLYDYCHWLRFSHWCHAADFPMPPLMILIFSPPLRCH